VGEVPDLASDSETALLCAPEDDVALADALMRALDLPTAQSQRVCSRARQDIVERFADRVIAAQYETVYRSVLSRN
jgi:glycosyltransferase involved in cell wall biosynthesis